MKRADEVEETNGSVMALDRDIYRELGDVETHAQLQAFARSTKIALDRDRLQLMLCGTDLGHHDADPHLAKYADSLPIAVTEGEFAEFHERLTNYDLCMEDSWTGYFVSRCLVTWTQAEPMVLLHLDDHTDMMDTLLVFASDGLLEPGAGARFDPANPSHWSTAIRSGAIGIGSFVTALYYLPQLAHVLHLNHSTDCSYQRSAVVRREVELSLLPRAHFVGIEKQTQVSGEQLGTYASSIDAARLLGSIPEGRLIVHIDLDYFINDYNGNLGQEPALSVDALRGKASERMEKFFNALSRTGVTVERWIIATSPGFCSALHWEWLLGALTVYIRDLSAVQIGSGDSTH